MAYIYGGATKYIDRSLVSTLFEMFYDLLLLLHS